MADTTPFGTQADVTLKTNFFATRDMCNVFLPIIKPGGRSYAAVLLHNLLVLFLPLKPLHMYSQVGLWTSPAWWALWLWPAAVQNSRPVSAATASQRRNWSGWWSDSWARLRRGTTQNEAGPALRMASPKPASPPWLESWPEIWAKRGLEMRSCATPAVQDGSKPTWLDQMHQSHQMRVLSLQCTWHCCLRGPKSPMGSLCQRWKFSPGEKCKRNVCIKDLRNTKINLKLLSTMELHNFVTLMWRLKALHFDQCFNEQTLKTPKSTWINNIWASSWFNKNVIYFSS